MKTKAGKIKEIQNNLLESHKLMIRGYMSYGRYLSIEKSAKLRLTEIRQEKYESHKFNSQ